MFCKNYPYTSYNEYNLDWLLDKIKSGELKLDDLVKLIERNEKNIAENTRRIDAIVNEQYIASVTDYGADPTGAVDSYDAFKAAYEHVDAGGLILVPHGVYNLSDDPVTDKSVRWIVSTGTKFTGAGAGDPAIWQGC